MKKVICMLALLAGTMTMFAQTKFHDREYSEVTGPVKSIKTSVMGMDQTTIMSMMGNDIEIKITYDEKGMRSAQSMDFNGQAMEIPYTDYKFDDRGNWISRKTSMMGQEMVENRTIEYFE